MPCTNTRKAKTIRLLIFAQWNTNKYFTDFCSLDVTNRLSCYHLYLRNVVPLTEAVRFDTDDYTKSYKANVVNGRKGHQRAAMLLNGVRLHVCQDANGAIGWHPTSS